MKYLLSKTYRVLVLLLVISISFISTAQNYYWVGDGGNWSDVANHWSNVSGGAAGVHSAPPGDGARVIFDVNSFSTPGQTVIYDVGSAEIGDMSWKTVLNTPTFFQSEVFPTTYKQFLALVEATFNKLESQYNCKYVMK